MPMEVTDGGTETEVRLEQPLNAELPIEVRDSGRVTEVRLSQPSNA